MDEVTIVTGGSRGIGATTCRLLAAAGHRVVVGYHSDPDAAEQVASQTGGVPGRVDTTDAESVAALFDRAAQHFGPATGLVNNAGVGSLIGPFVDLTEADLRRVVDVNLVGYVLCAREAARRGVKNIVNVSSAAATLGSPGEYIHYAMTKAATDTLTVGLSKELAAQGVRVNTVSPGIIRTSFHATQSGVPDRPDRLAHRIPLGRPGMPEEVAEAIAWLMSPKASFVTGANIRVSGGV